MKTKVCKRCNEPKSIKKFGKCAYYLKFGAKDGRQTRCKPCVRAVAAERREMLKGYERVHKIPLITREQVAQVRRAIILGYRTRDDIRAFTGLHEDIVSDALAILAFDDRTVRVDRSGSEAKFYPVRVAA